MKTEFRGIPLIEIPKNIPSYNFLKENFGKEKLKEYNSVVKQDYKDNSALKVLSFTEEVVKGSNSYSIFIMNKILEKEGLRTATPVDAQKIIDNDSNFLREFYVDLGVVLRTEDNPNSHLAKQLGKQAKDFGYEFSNENTLVFKASDLELIIDDNSHLGLGFKIKESATAFNAPELSNKNYGKNFITTNEKGVPIFDKNRDRTNYTRDDGLSRFDLDGDSDLDSWVDDLAVSGSCGRVVVINDAEGVAQKNFESYIRDLEKERDGQIAKIHSKYKKAMSVLKS